MDRTLPINEAEAEAVIASLTNPVTRNLVKIAMATARSQFMRTLVQSESEWHRQLPAAPFDMAFFARVLAEALKNADQVRAILDGSSVEDASGWGGV